MDNVLVNLRNNLENTNYKLFETIKERRDIVSNIVSRKKEIVSSTGDIFLISREKKVYFRK